MDKICKISSVFLNVLNIIAGIAVAVIMFSKKSFAVVIAIKDMPPYAQLFINLLMFQIGIVLVMVAISILADRKVNEFTFPVIYMVLPIIVGLIGIYFGIVSPVAIEKIIVIIGALVYVALSGVLLYFSSKLVESFSKTK